MLNVNDVNQIYLGCQGENLARTIIIDVKPWLVAYPGGTVAIWHKRNGAEEETATGAVFDSEAGTITWRPTGTDTYVFGEGEAEIRLTVGNVIKKSRTITTDVAKAVTGADGEALESGWQGYLDAIQRAAGVAITKNGLIQFAVNAAGHLILSYTEDVPIPAEESDETDEEGDIVWIDKDLGKVTPSDEQVQEAANTYLESVITNPDSPPLDRSLSSNASAAPADLVGNLKRTISGITKATELTGWDEGHYFVLGSTATSADVNNPSGTSANYANNSLACEEGDIFLITSVGGSGARCFAFLSSASGENNILERAGSSQSSTGITNYRAVAPENAKYAIFNVDVRHPYYVYKLNPTLDYLEDCLTEQGESWT